MGLLTWAKQLDDRVEQSVQRRLPWLARTRQIPVERRRRYFQRFSVASASAAALLWALVVLGIPYLWGAAPVTSFYAVFYAFLARRFPAAERERAPSRGQGQTARR